MQSAEIYTVGAAAKAAELSPHTLRAWEARYGVVSPARDGAGRRKYSQADVDLLCLLKQLTDAGHAIGRLADLGLDDLRQLLRGGAASTAENLAEAEDVVQQLLSATMDFDAIQLDRRLGCLLAMMPANELVAQILHPFLQKVGELWAEGELSIAQERLVSSTLQSRILGNLAQQSNLRKPQIALGTFTGENHTMGLMLLALLAQERGICCRYLGLDMPVQSLIQASEKLQVDVLAISLVNPQPDDRVHAMLDELRSDLDQHVRLWIGGARSGDLTDLPAGCELSPGLDEMQALVNTVRPVH